MKFDAASFNPFKVGQSTPKTARRKTGNTYKEQATARRKSYKRSTDLNEGRRRRSTDRNESWRDRKKREVTTRRLRSNSAKLDREGEAKTATNKEKLTVFYEKYNPTKVHEVDWLLEKYSGRETVMFRRLVNKYKADPSLLGFDEVTPSKSTADISQAKPSGAVSGTGFAFGISAKPATFGSSGTFSGFGTVASADNKLTSTSFTAPKNSFASIAVANSSFTVSQNTPTFGSLSLASPKGKIFGTGFGSIAASSSTPSTLSNSWGLASNIRRNNSFDSDALGMDCD